MLERKRFLGVFASVTSRKTSSGGRISGRYPPSGLRVPAPGSERRRTITLQDRHWHYTSGAILVNFCIGLLSLAITVFIGIECSLKYCAFLNWLPVTDLPSGVTYCDTHRTSGILTYRVSQKRRPFHKIQKYF